jgi:LssY-like putative type I secretion system component LssY
MLCAHLRKIPAYLLLMVFLLPCVSAQEMSAVPAKLTIPDGTPIHLQLAENVSSAHARIGDSLDFVVVKDVNLGGFTAIPAGTMATGSVTRVKGRRFLGIGGNVSLKVDSLELANGDQLRLRARLDVKGRSRTKLMAAAMIATALVFLPATPVFLLTRGHESTVVKSTEITAQIDGATSVLLAGLPRSPESYSELDEMMDYLPPRVFSGEGREGDMLNLVFVANQADLQEAFQRAGWVKTDKWNPIFVWHLLRHRTNDAQLPMARFYLFGRVQDYSYALPDPNATMSRRHHLRIWKTAYTIGGKAIWAAAATHDIAIEIAKRGHLVNHRIDPAVDAERDFVGTNLAETSSVSRQEYLDSPAPVFQAQTASGESYHSDSRILLLDLHEVIAAKTRAQDQTSAFVQPVQLTAPAPVESSQSNLISPF